MEAIGSLVVFFSAVFSLMTPGVNGAVLGLSVSYALQVSHVFSLIFMLTRTVQTLSDFWFNFITGNPCVFMNI